MHMHPCELWWGLLEKKKDTSFLVGLTFKKLKISPDYVTIGKSFFFFLGLIGRILASSWWFVRLGYSHTSMCCFEIRISPSPPLLLWVSTKRQKRKEGKVSPKSTPFRLKCIATLHHVYSTGINVVTIPRQNFVMSCVVYTTIFIFSTLKTINNVLRFEKW